MTWRVVLTGGGTGGHTYPLVAVAEVARAEGEFLFVGAGRFEAEVASGAGLRFEQVPAGGVVGKGAAVAAANLARTLRGVWRARRLLARFRPHVVLSTGGYAGFPATQAAVGLRIPVVLVEPNATPGLTNRLVARRAHRVCVAFPHLVARLGPRAVWTGAPLRAAALAGQADRARARYGLEEGRTTVLVVGGSQGARKLNRAVREAVRWLGDRADLQMLHATGRARAGLEGEVSRGALLYRAVDYADPIGDAYAASHLVVARAGALTCAELVTWGLPAVLVPLPIAGGHQTHNARVLEELGVAVVVRDHELSGERLAQLIIELVDDPQRRDRMAQASRALARPDAARAVWQEVVRAAQEV